MKSDHEMSDLEDALRADLPSAEDGARVRARLVAAGVLAVSATAGSVAGAATVGAEGVSLGARVAALSWGTKLAVVSAVSVGVGVGAVTTVQSSATKARVPGATVVASSVRRAPAPAMKATAPMATRDVPIAAPDVPGSAAVVDVARSRAAADKRSLVAKAPSPASAIVNTAEPAPASSVGFPTDANNRASVTTLREERALVDGALIAMSSGDRKRAAELLDAHASRFPNGLLRLERERARSKLDTEAR